MIKEALFIHCEVHLKEKLDVLEKRKIELKNALKSESKSSAGDKHETGRAMIHLEREKLGNQIAMIEQDTLALRPLKNHVKKTAISIGSAVHTDKANYYIAIAASPCKIDLKTYFCISPLSPIGKLLIGKKTKEHITFNNTKSTILEIL